MLLEAFLGQLSASEVPPNLGGVEVPNRNIMILKSPTPRGILKLVWGFCFNASPWVLIC